MDNRAKYDPKVRRHCPNAVDGFDLFQRVANCVIDGVREDCAICHDLLALYVLSYVPRDPWGDGHTGHAARS